MDTPARPIARLIAERYQVNYPFLLYAGRISPHKNVVRHDRSLLPR